MRHRRTSRGNYRTWIFADAATRSAFEPWGIGSDGFKAPLVKDHDLAPIGRAWKLNGAREISAARWHLALERALRRTGKSAADCCADRKSAPWKIAVAVHLKQSTHAGNRWLTEHLQMGTRSPSASTSAPSVITAARISPSSSSSLKNLKPDPLGRLFAAARLTSPRFAANTPNEIAALEHTVAEGFALLDRMEAEDAARGQGR